jgi:hypothetical protein
MSERPAADSREPAKTVHSVEPRSQSVVANQSAGRGQERPPDVATRHARRPAKIPNAFPDGSGKIPHNPAIVAGLGAIARGGGKARTLVGGWAQSENGQLYFAHHGRKIGRILVYPKSQSNSSCQDAPWGFVEGLSPFTADVALCVLAQMCEPTTGDWTKFPVLRSVPITADAILRYMGIKRRGQERRDLRRRVRDEMAALSILTFDVESFQAINPETNKYEKVSWRGDRLFDIVTVERRPLAGNPTDTDMVWLVRPGQWAYWWFNPATRVYIMRIVQGLLKLDHRDNRAAAALAKKIGQRVLFLYHGLPERVPLTLRIGNLLQSVGELPEPEARSAHWGAKTREHFEEAINLLGPGDGFTDGIDILAAVDWLQGRGPDDTDRVKGWLDRWLSASVVLTVRSADMHIKSEGEPWIPASVVRKQAEVQDCIGDNVRAARMRREPIWTQKKLAHEMGISNVYLSLVEDGKRQPSPALRNRLQQWCESLTTSEHF